MESQVGGIVSGNSVWLKGKKGVNTALQLLFLLGRAENDRKCHFDATADNDNNHRFARLILSQRTVKIFETVHSAFAKTHNHIAC